MELKTNYQYTYFIYPFAIKEENYKKYISSLIKNKSYQIKFFDSFKNIELFKYFVPNVKEKDFVSPSRKEVYDFVEALTSYKLEATARRTMGDDIDGACGQLRKNYIDSKK